MSGPQLILASASPRRSDLLRQLNVSFQVVEAGVEELHDSSLKVSDLCLINAKRKAQAVAERHPEALVLGADTLVAKDSKIFGKPTSLQQAREMLQKLSGLQHEVVTGVCLIRKKSNQEKIFAETTLVQFRELTPEIIETYLGKVHVLDKAGAYAIQEQGELIIERIEGSHSNVVGLPLEKLKTVLAEFGL
jgi:septum formation protein